MESRAAHGAAAIGLAPLASAKPGKTTCMSSFRNPLYVSTRRQLGVPNVPQSHTVFETWDQCAMIAVGRRTGIADSFFPQATGGDPSERG